ncbi:hypothetical protein PSTG_00360 [Puccinia striiformis f. sp. tritici PST-78]|uniref:Uncharacterized protein n=1 Tax=Puccinia striiformis f. sp. tritici PST-78 TaxID=1165861 RepID=A0A0L0W4S7_9BASI|nr:hypothetical protein PSTG_00360 [Puccinia striiformis f. sp. tritici PST-78]
MVPSTHIGRRKIARSSHPEYQKLIDGDSIYTCSKFTAERDSRMGESILRSSKRFKRLLLVDSGPWFLELGPVLERRDEDRHRLWKRQKNKRLKRRASLAQSEDPQQAEDEEPTTGRRRSGRQSPVQSEDPQQAEEEEGDMTIASAVVMPSGPSTIPTNNTLEAPSRALTPDLPSSDLLRSIHHESISFYGSHNVISIPTASRGPRPRKWEEPVAMTRALDGSALMAIGVLLEEITKDLIENGLSSANPRINAE